MLLCLNQCGNNETLEKSALKTAKNHEKEAKLFEQKNNYLIQTKEELEIALNASEKNKERLQKQISKVQIVPKVIIDTTIANKYLKDRYKDNSIQVVNDLIQADVCKAENLILEKAVINRDSIIDFNKRLYNNEVEISNNLNNSNKELNLANKEYQNLFLNEQEKNKKEKRKSFLYQVGFFVATAFLILK